MIIFSYAPAGLGHLRVADALYDGLPKDADPLILGSDDENIRRIHRVMSTYPVIRQLTEALQSEGISKLTFPLYRQYLRKRTKGVYFQLKTILEQRLDKPETVLVVATHFGLAHQLAAIKKQLEMEEEVRIILAVIVTDDSPQEIWYVEGADMIFVPSHITKIKLEQYGEEMHFRGTKFIVNPYPISPILGKRLEENEFKDKEAQLMPIATRTIHVSVPISGAAVGTNYNFKLMEALHKANNRYLFHITAKNAPYTISFLNNCLNMHFIKETILMKDREVVVAYEEQFKNDILAMEITKPSEQAFKAILSTESRGGVILLFSRPVGRQEYDNLNFLRQHFLLPKLDLNKQLWELVEKGGTLTDEEKTELLQKARRWRGMLLPDDPVLAADFIEWCLKEKIFSEMLLCKAKARKKDQYPEELGKKGVEQFWKKMEEAVKYPNIQIDK
jgi:hypothetical protein